VLGEAVAGKLEVQLDEQAVAVDFGQDTGGGDGEADCVAVDDGLLGAGPVNGVAAVDEKVVGGLGLAAGRRGAWPAERPGGY
jgi:hypothetical protein